MFFLALWSDHIQNDLDEHEISLSLGVEALFESPWGIMLISPPKPIVMYK